MCLVTCNFCCKHAVCCFQEQKFHLKTCCVLFTFFSDLRVNVRLWAAAVTPSSNKQSPPVQTVTPSSNKQSPPVQTNFKNHTQCSSRGISEGDDDYANINEQLDHIEDNVWNLGLPVLWLQGPPMRLSHKDSQDSHHSILKCWRWPPPRLPCSNPTPPPQQLMHNISKQALFPLKTIVTKLYALLLQ